MSQTERQAAFYAGFHKVMDILDFIHDLRWQDLPDPARDWARNCLLDLTGVAFGATPLPMSRIARNHAARQFGGDLRIAFDDRRASPSGVALAMGLTIDALDGHDGYNPAKGHAGCGVYAGLFALAQDVGLTDFHEFLTCLVIGYEIACRTAVAQHRICPDYHTSGAWVSVAIAALGARLLRLDRDQTRHAMGIAEYHGPRSQMMRCIDFPTMTKDGAYGAMTGVSAVYLAQDGFTGAPALTIEQDDIQPDIWADLGDNWLVTQQYFKPYPVCRWAQAPIEGVLALRRAHNLTAADVENLSVETFHESCRLATRFPKTTEEAQYSTSFPAAVALVHGDVAPHHLVDDALNDSEVLRLSGAMDFTENDQANEAFPIRRYARTTLTLRDGRELQSDWMEPIWDPTSLPTRDELIVKYRKFMGPVTSEAVTDQLQDLILNGSGNIVPDLINALAQSPS